MRLAAFLCLWSGPAMAEVCDKHVVDWSLGLGGLIPHPNLTWHAVLPLVTAGFLFLITYGLIRERWWATIGATGLAALAILNIVDWYWDPTGLAAIAHREGCRASPVVVGGLFLAVAAVLLCYRPRWAKRITSSDS